MNYSIINTISTVINYKLCEKYIVYLDTKNKLYYDNNVIDTEVDYFDVFDKKIYFEKYKKVIEFSIIEKSKNQYFELFPNGNIQDEMFLNIFDSKFENIDLGTLSYRFRLYNLNKTIIHETKKRFILGYGFWKNPYYYHSEGKNLLKSLDILKEKYLWKYSVSEIGKYTDTDNYFKPYQHEGEVRKIIGVCGDILLVVVSGGFEGKNNVSNQLIGLSCQSGELLWRLDMFDANGIRTHYGSYENLQIDEPNKRLLGLYSQGFIKVAVETGVVERFKHLSYSTGEELLRFEYKGKILTNIYSETLVGEHLYFRATNIANRRHSLSSNVIGAYNHQTETIDWLYEFEDLAPSVSIKESPKVEGNRLYALDSGGTLHIFERDFS